MLADTTSRPKAAGAYYVLREQSYPADYLGGSVLVQFRRYGPFGDIIGTYGLDCICRSCIQALSNQPDL
jgi:hypothetical protein